MTKRLKPLIIGNWKMNPATLARAEKIIVDIQKGLKGRSGASEIAVAPPAVFLSELQQLSGSQKLTYAAQDVSPLESGAYTGEISVSMLRSSGVKAVIIGHSERRELGDDNEIVKAKLKQVIDNKLTAILCIGERVCDGSGDYFNAAEEQLTHALTGVSPASLKHVVIAYEPVWAIGTGKNATSEQVEEMRLFIQKVLVDTYGRDDSEGVKIIYGGSVRSDHVEELLKVGQVDGFLVGGASLEAKEFVSIIKIADQYARLA
jgi:triosephosphate isomerase